MTIMIQDISSPCSFRELFGRMLMALGRMMHTDSGNSRTGIDESAFRELADRYDRLVAGICLSFSGCREDFEDLRQEVLINMWRGFSSFRQDSAESTWIYRVALNTCVSFQRREKRRSNVSMRELFAELYDNSSADDIERYRLMYEMIGRLKPLDKSVMLMWLDGKNYEEIAEVVGVSRDSIASRLKRGKEKLNEMYSTTAKTK